ncbi:hypothetical protein MXD63_42285, partial [Frankia sp. Cpl3]|nr:hypothetical protein [Frankia sp. Cpl3]
MPHLKQGLTGETAEAAAHLLRKELKAAAVAVSDTEHILAHVGVGAAHHLRGEPLKTEISRKAIVIGEVQLGLSREQIRCQHKDCRLTATIIIPIKEAGRVVG